MSNEQSLQRAIAQQLASLAAAGVQQIGVGQPVEIDSLGELIGQPVAEEVGAVASEPSLPIPVEKPTAVKQPAVEPAAPVAATPEPAAALATPASSVPPPPVAPAPIPAAPAASEGDAATRLTVLAEQVAECTLCDELCAGRTQTVFGVGNPNARLCFLGEAPGADEDRLGEPFVGKAGQLLTKIIGAMGLTRDDVYILNVLKCRPPGNRNPAADEVANCRPFFESQLAMIQPEFICCLGSVAAQNLLGTTTSIGRLRGQFHDWKEYKVLATYHPAYLLREPAAKKKVWDDMQMLMKEMGLELPSK